MSEWVLKPGTKLPLMCRLGLHIPGEIRRNVEPDYEAVVTLVVQRRYCLRCKAMNIKELERHA